MSGSSPHPDATHARLLEAVGAYAAKFGVQPPWLLFGVSEARIADVISDAVKTGKQIPRDYDWYAHLPPGAVA